MAQSFVESFRTLLNNSGIHQNNNFDVEILFDGKSKLSSNIQKLGYDPIKASELLRNCCYQVNPGIGTIQTSMARTYGEPFEMPYGKSYDPLNISFYLDNNGDSYKILYAWMKTVWDPTERVVGYLNDYSATINVIFNRRNENNKIMRIKYEKAYIKTISAIPLSGMSGNTATQFDATFSYRRALLEYYPVSRIANKTTKEENEIKQEGITLIKSSSSDVVKNSVTKTMEERKKELFNAEPMSVDDF